MNYFQLYELPQQIVIDKEKVQKKYYQLCRQYHPDKLINASDDALKIGQDLITSVNAGYKILMDDTLLFNYYLQLNNIISEDDNIKLPNDFLMEMMDANEQIIDAQVENNSAILNQLKNNFGTLESNFKTNIISLLNKYEQEPTENVKQEIQIIYFKQKYLKRIFELLNK
jgi:molecular chaperone HscB